MKMAQIIPLRRPHVVQSVALSPKGHLLFCCRFELEGNAELDFGSVSEASATRKVEAANNDSIVRAIAFLGPVFLKDVVEQIVPEVTFPERFGSVCEVCRSVVKNPAAVEA